ncbi:MAG: BrnA antitoxin family protein [Burkholderiaceae bacterium]
MIDDENPEWTAKDVANAKPAREVLPRLFGADAAREMLKPRGRPKAAVTKARLTIRMDPQALARWRASGPGWQTRAAELLAKKAPQSIAPPPARPARRS